MTLCAKVAEAHVSRGNVRSLGVIAKSMASYAYQTPLGDKAAEMLKLLISKIHTLYSSETTAETRRDVDSWLNNFQMTKEAWEMSHKVLVMQDVGGSGVDDQVLYFAANTLHKKSRQDVTDLNVSDLDALRHSLMSLITYNPTKRTSRTDYVWHTQLCAPTVMA